MTLYNLAAIQTVFKGLPWRWIGLCAAIVAILSYTYYIGHSSASESCKAANDKAAAKEVLRQESERAKNANTIRRIDNQIEAADADRGKLASDYAKQLRGLQAAASLLAKRGDSAALEDDRAPGRGESRVSDDNARAQLTACNAAADALTIAVAELQAIAKTAARQIGDVGREIAQ